MSTLTSLTLRRPGGADLLLERLEDPTYMPALQQLKYEVPRDIDWDADRDDLDAEERELCDYADKLDQACEPRAIDLTVMYQADYVQPWDGACVRIAPR